MSILSDFVNTIGDLYLDPEEDRQTSLCVEAGGLTITGTFLPTPGAFDLASLLESTSIHQTIDDSTVILDINGSLVRVIQMALSPHSSYEGIHELVGDNTMVFSGSFGELIGDPILDSMQSLIAAIAVFNPIRTMLSRKSWTDILESIGPIACHQESVSTPFERLAEIGMFKTRQVLFVPRILHPQNTRSLAARTGIPGEARQGFVNFFQTSDGPDVAILRLYRIFELEFASTIKNAIQTSSLPRVWTLIQSTMSRSEMELLKDTCARSHVGISSFSNVHFANLFGASHRPRRDHYKCIVTWLDSNPNAISHPPQPCTAAIIYYVRCALVHSKIADGEPFLFPPFTQNQVDALSALADDMLLIVKDILFL